MKKILAALCFLFLITTASAEGRYYTEEDILQMQRQYTIGCLSQAHPGEISARQAEEKARAAMDQAGDVLYETIKVNLVQWKDGHRSYVVSAFAEGQMPPYRDMSIDPISGEVTAYHTRNAHEIEMEWQSLYGPLSGWEQMDLALFDALYRSARNVYCMPMSGHLKKEEAVRMAQDALIQQYPDADRNRDSLEMISHMRYEKGSHDIFSWVWYVIWQHPEEGMIYQVVIDGVTEEVLYVYDKNHPNNLG